MAEVTEGSIEIAAGPAELLRILTDFEAYPQWAGGVRNAEIIKRDPKGRPTEVSFEVSQMGIAATYTLAFRYRTGSRGLSWSTKAASGAVRDIAGEYSFERAAGGTKVTYRASIEPAIPMIGLMKRQAEKAIINAALGGLKRRAEGG